MDINSTLAELKTSVSDFCESRDWRQFHTPDQLAIGISTEAGELLSLFRFKTEAQIINLLSSNKEREEIEDEVADVLFFLCRFAEVCNIDLAVALETKLAKNNAKYPVALSKGKNLKYTEFK